MKLTFRYIFFLTISFFLIFKITSSQILIKDTFTNKFGYTNSEGLYIIDAKFESACKFQKKYANVKFKGRWGVIDKTGNFVIDPIYDFISKIYDNHIIVKRDSILYSLINLSGSVYFEFEYIPLSHEFIQEYIFNAKYEHDTLIKKMIYMCDRKVRPDRHKISSECIIMMSSFSEYISSILIKYILNNRKKIKKDFIIYDNMEKDIREGLKTGKWYIE